MSSTHTTLCIVNTTGMDITRIDISEIDNSDWDGNSRPDHNFQGVSIKNNDSQCEREEINNNASKSAITLTCQGWVPAEQFVLGGKGGYLQDSLLTDNGISASAEVQLPVRHVFRGKGLIQVIPFVDFGTGWNSSGQAHPSPNTLASVGLGLQWQQDHLTARLNWGIPLVLVHSPYGTALENALYLSVQYNP